MLIFPCWLLRVASSDLCSRIRYGVGLRGSVNPPPCTIRATRGFSWCLFDWANSPLPTVIITFVFSAYFARGVVGNEVEGTVLESGLQLPGWRLPSWHRYWALLPTRPGQKALACRFSAIGILAAGRSGSSIQPGGCAACPNRCWAGAYR